MQLAYILIVSFGSLLLGYAVRRVYTRKKDGKVLTEISSRIKLVAVTVFLPVTAISSLWGFSPASGRLAFFSFFGALSLFIGALSALVLIKIFAIEPFKAGSVFTSSMFSNIGALSAFIVFVLYGDEGFAYIQLYALFEQPIYYTMGFPLSYAVSTGTLGKFRFSSRLLMEKPVAFFPLGAVLIGVLLRASGIPKPDFMFSLSKILVPLITFLFGFAIGITLKVSATARYKKEILLVHAVKFLVVPAIIIPLGMLAGFGSISGGVPIKALAIVAFSPVAFLAVIPPTIYGFDVDLANSAWLMTTVSFVFIIPALLAFL